MQTKKNTQPRPSPKQTKRQEQERIIGALQKRAKFDLNSVEREILRVPFDALANEFLLWVKGTPCDKIAKRLRTDGWCINLAPKNLATAVEDMFRQLQITLSQPETPCIDDDTSSTSCVRPDATDSDANSPAQHKRQEIAPLYKDPELWIPPPPPTADTKAHDSLMSILTVIRTQHARLAKFVEQERESGLIMKEIDGIANSIRQAESDFVNLALKLGIIRPTDDMEKITKVIFQKNEIILRETEKPSEINQAISKFLTALDGPKVAN
jgi:hypothetical protein